MSPQHILLHSVTFDKQRYVGDNYAKICYLIPLLTSSIKEVAFLHALVYGSLNVTIINKNRETKKTKNDIKDSITPTNVPPLKVTCKAPDPGSPDQTIRL